MDRTRDARSPQRPPRRDLPAVEGFPVPTEQSFAIFGEADRFQSLHGGQAITAEPREGPFRQFGSSESRVFYGRAAFSWPAGSPGRKWSGGHTKESTESEQPGHVTAPGVYALGSAVTKTGFVAIKECEGTLCCSRAP